MNAPQWLDVSQLSFTVMLLLEQPHLEWFPRDWPDNRLGVAMKYNPGVYDYFVMRLADADWLKEMVDRVRPGDAARRRDCELAVMRRICDWLVYVAKPEVYDQQPFVGWDNRELTGLVDFSNKVVADIGAGTGRLLEPVMDVVRAAYAVEPIRALRRYMRSKFAAYRDKLFPLDGVIADIPLLENTCDVVMAGHVFGDAPVKEIKELERVTRPGGMVILCPGNNDCDNAAHRALLQAGYRWSRFEEPADGMKRKYWKQV